MTYEGDGSDHLDLTVGSFDDRSRFRPASHAGVESRNAEWLDTSGLPEHRTTDLTHITAKWIAACGKLPD